MGDIRYVNRDTTPLFRTKTGDSIGLQLLWGDRVELLDGGSFSRHKVRARGRTGFVKKRDVGTESLLEFYFIDVGQGDGVLIRTPDGSSEDGRHILIDGGWPRRGQPTGKNAADFIDWKFKKDYGRDVIDLDAVICSHNDQDHYGGLWDLLNTSAAARAELDCKDVVAEAIYHAGLSWWVGPGGRTLGPTTDTSAGSMHTRLLEDRSAVQTALRSDATPKLQGEWAKFWRQAVRTRTRGGSPTPIQRLSHASEALPHFDDPDGVSVRVLAPVEFEVDGGPAIRRFSGGTSKNTNGNSILLRVDYGSTRVLLTGDLNQGSQHSLLADWSGRHGEFACDVAKGCHHGSGDISMRFLNAMSPTATIISSGDSEGHDHPRPEVTAASGATGFQVVSSDRMSSPLVYITELARSVTLGTPTRMEFTDDSGNTHIVTGDGFKNVKVTYKVTQAGDRGAKTFTRTLQRKDKTTPRQLVDFTVFGLINVRTDGRKILIAARNEAKQSWNIKTFEGRF